MSRAERLRWRIAGIVNRLPGQCWSRLVDWVLFEPEPDGEPEDRRRGLPWRPIDAVCRRDAARCGACYCGKFRLTEPAAAAGGASDG